MTESAYLGARTVLYYVDDLDAAKQWYQKVLNLKPYFDTPYYVGFNVGGYELGLHPLESPDAATSPEDPVHTVSYWGVGDAARELARLVELGGTVRSDLQDVGDGILIADVVDPFGNVFGIIENSNFPNTVQPE